MWLTKQRVKIKVDGHAWKTRGGSYQREDTVNLEVLTTAAHRPRELGFAAATSLHEDSSAAVAETGIATAAAASPPLVERTVNLLGQAKRVLKITRCYSLTNLAQLEK